MKLKLYLSAKTLVQIKQKQVILHELGHIGQTEKEYQNALIRCENEANRNMIHHLLVDAIGELDNPKEFDYLKFMEYYNLKTIADETMVKEEYLSIINYIKGVKNEF